MAEGRSGERTSCCLYRTGDGDLVGLMARLLEMSGVRVSRTDAENRLVTGSVGSRWDGSRCKVLVRLYSREELTLVETTVRGPRGAGGDRTAAEASERLRDALE